LLLDAGHNPSLDTIRRITSTLEAISAMSELAARSDTPHPGRLTHDVDPPGFESFASFIPGAGTTQPRKEPARVTPSQKSSGALTNTRRKAAPDDDADRDEEARKAKIAAAKVSLQDAKRSLAEARARLQGLEAAQKKADAEAKKAEKQRRDAEERLKKAKAASEDANQHARNVAAELEEAASALDDNERTVEKASKELESLFRESSGR
jgi:phage-related minor tail protein